MILTKQRNCNMVNLPQLQKQLEQEEEKVKDEDRLTGT